MSKSRNKRKSPRLLESKAKQKEWGEAAATLKVPKVELPEGMVRADVPDWDAGLGSHVSGRVSLGNAKFDPQAVLKAVHTPIPMPEPDEWAKPLIEALGDDADEILLRHPDLAMEGLARLGRVMVVPNHDVEAGAFNPLDVKARVVGDLRSDRISRPIPAGDVNQIDYAQMAANTARLIPEAVQVDVQSIYDRWLNSGGNDLYEQRLIPPWYNALMVYNTPGGNVWAMHLVGSDLRGEWATEHIEELKWQPLPPADHTIDWDRVRWLFSVQVYIGGLSEGDDGAVKWHETFGPLMIWRVAVYEDGEPADVHWSQLTRNVEAHKFNNALGVMIETINMLNCTNVHLAVPTRPMPRAQRRRFDRMGIRFSEIHVKPTSKSYKGTGEALADMEMPIHGVRGHYATYGQDGRGLLFGRLAGRFWIPPHVRGSREVGGVDQSYVTE